MALQVDKLQSLKELILKKDLRLLEARLETQKALLGGTLNSTLWTHLLQEFLPELVVLQADPTPSVRKFLPEFLEAVPPAALQASSMQLALQCLHGLLQDTTAAVVKAAIMASGPVFRAAFALVAGQVGGIYSVVLGRMLLVVFVVICSVLHD